MAPRKRSRRNADLPENLYATTSKGQVYYRYKRPDTGLVRGMGNNRQEAIAAARQLNSILGKGKDLVGSVMGTADKDMAHLIKRFREEFLPDKKLAPSTEKLWGYRLDRLSKDLGGRPIKSIDVRGIAEYLDENFTRDSYIKHRSTLVELFRFAAMKGLYPSDLDNPAEVTYARSDYEKNRQRITPPQFAAIHAISPGWMQIAMEVALVTLQGRNEVINMKFADYDESTGTLTVVRQKVQKHEHAFLKIESPRLAEIISRARRSGIVSPYVVHRDPERRNAAEGRHHWSQLTANHFTSEFRRLRDETGLFDDVPRNQRPTFHEIRSLGSWLYKKQGFDNESYIQPLMAHADEKMTKHYQEGHEQEWVHVRADLDLTNILPR